MVIPSARSLTQQTARKANALKGCDKNRRSRCCARWHRRIITTGVARLAIIPFLSATWLMEDSISGSLFQLHAHGRGRADTQRIVCIDLIELDAHRHALRDLHPVAGGVLGRQQRKSRAGAAA